MSFWWYSKDSKDKPTLTSNAVYGRSWLSCIYASYAYTLVALIVLLLLVPNYLPGLHWLLQMFLICVCGGITFIVSLWLFKATKEESDQSQEDDF